MAEARSRANQFVISRLKDSLTVDINIAADVCAPQRVGDLAGDRICKERGVHHDLICVPGDILDYTSSFCPPDDKTERILSPQKKQNKKHEEERKEDGGSHVLVSTALFCVNKSSSWVVFVHWFEHVYVAALHAVTGPRWHGEDSNFLVMPGRRGSTEFQLRKTKLKW